MACTIRATTPKITIDAPIGTASTSRPILVNLTRRATHSFYIAHSKVLNISGILKAWGCVTSLHSVMPFLAASRPTALLVALVVAFMSFGHCLAADLVAPTDALSTAENITNIAETLVSIPVEISTLDDQALDRLQNKASFLAGSQQALDLEKGLFVPINALLQRLFSIFDGSSASDQTAPAL